MHHELSSGSPTGRGALGRASVLVRAVTHYRRYGSPPCGSLVHFGCDPFQVTPERRQHCADPAPEEEIAHPGEAPPGCAGTQPRLGATKHRQHEVAAQDLPDQRQVSPGLTGLGTNPRFGLVRLLHTNLLSARDAGVPRGGGPFRLADVVDLTRDRLGRPAPVKRRRRHLRRREAAAALQLYLARPSPLHLAQLGHALAAEDQQLEGGAERAGARLEGCLAEIVLERRHHRFNQLGLQVEAAQSTHPRQLRHPRVALALRPQRQLQVAQGRSHVKPDLERRLVQTLLQRGRQKRRKPILQHSQRAARSTEAHSHQNEDGPWVRDEVVDHWGSKAQGDKPQARHEQDTRQDAHPAATASAGCRGDAGQMQRIVAQMGPPVPAALARRLAAGQKRTRTHCRVPLASGRQPPAASIVGSRVRVRDLSH
eukprot:scaffold8972_cov118-Isochrysis_galbana.AAC.10